MDNRSTQLTRLKKIAGRINFLLFLVHTGLLFMFYFLNTDILVVVNIFSVLLYFSFFFIQNKTSLNFRVCATYMEVLVHLIFATIFLGWDTGFSLYCFALVAIIFFTSYNDKLKKMKYDQSLFFALATIAVFLFLRIFTYHYTTYYTIPQIIHRIFYIGNAVLVFSLIGLFMTFYLKHVISSEQKLKTIADNDELTQLYNRRKMRDFLGIAYTDAVENDTPFSIAIFDIDDFKTVNDTYGHDAGDQVLKYVSGILRSYNSESVAVSRWGGEEFLLLEKIHTSIIPNVLRIEKIRKQIAEHEFCYDKNYFTITITGGISSFRQGDSISSVIRHADEKLYEGKLRGKNCIVATKTVNR